MGRKPRSGSTVRGSLITSAAWVGKVDDAMQDYQLRHRLGSGGAPPHSVFPTDKIKVKLASGGPYVLGTPLEVGAAVFSPVSRENNWHVAALRSSYRPLGILLEPATYNNYSWLQLSGICPAYTNVIATAHTHAFVSSGGSNLITNFAGRFELITTPTATGTQMCLVRLACNPSIVRKAKLTSTITAGSYGSADVYLGGSNVGTLDGSSAGQKVYYDWMESGVASIATTTEVLIAWYDDQEKWGIVQYECAP